MIHRCDLSSEERNFEGIARDGLRVPDGAGDVFCPYGKKLPGRAFSFVQGLDEAEKGFICNVVAR